MKVIFDPETDTLSLVFRDEQVAESDEAREGIIFDYNENGDVISIEVLEASEHVAELQGIAQEVKGRQKIS